MTATETSRAPTASRSSLDFGLVVAGLVLLVLGTTWLLDVSGAVDMPAAVVLPSLLTAVGLAVMVGSFQGDHPGLVTTGVLLAVATVFAALAPAEALRGGMGQRDVAVTSPSQLESDYTLAVGQLTLDLRDLELDGARQVDISVGTGKLVVLVPRHLQVSVDAAVTAGEVHILGRRDNGVALHHSYHSNDSEADDRLHLDIEMGAGSIEVRRR